MNNFYKNFIQEIDIQLKEIFETQKEYIFCKKMCSFCCEKGDFPLSQAEFSYLTEGYIKLPYEQKIIVQKNVKKLLEEKEKNKNKRFEHKCPFLINKQCCVYEYRGIICRTFGTCYFDDTKGYVRLPDCVHNGLNYSQYFDEKTNILSINEVPMINLRTDRILNGEVAKKYNILSGEIRPLLEWVTTNIKKTC